MSGNGKIMCNHGVNLFKCQTCIDALVAEQIEKQEQRITELEQQLRAAKPKLYRHLKTGGIYELVAIAQNESNLTSLVIYKSVDTGAIWARPHKEFFDGRFEEYTNNLEGK